MLKLAGGEVEDNYFKSQPSAENIGSKKGTSCRTWQLCRRKDKAGKKRNLFGSLLLHCVGVDIATCQGIAGNWRLQLQTIQKIHWFGF